MLIRTPSDHLTSRLYVVKYPESKKSPNELAQFRIVIQIFDVLFMVKSALRQWVSSISNYHSDFWLAAYVEKLGHCVYVNPQCSFRDLKQLILNKIFHYYFLLLRYHFLIAFILFDSLVTDIWFKHGFSYINVC